MESRNILMTKDQIDRLIQDVRSVPTDPVGEHLSDDDFVNYAAEYLTEEEEQRLDVHLLSCSVCSVRMEHLLETSEAWRGELGAQRLAQLQAARPVRRSPEGSLWDRLKTRLTNLGVSADVTCWLDSWSEAETRELGFAGVLSGKGSVSGSVVKEVTLESLRGDVAALTARVPWVGERLRIVKTFDQGSGACVYSAEVDRSRDIDDHRGTLCVVLLGAGEEWCEARLTARAPSAMFIGEMRAIDWQTLSLSISVE